jgi:hypothetical protein
MKYVVQIEVFTSENCVNSKRKTLKTLRDDIINKFSVNGIYKSIPINKLNVSVKSVTFIPEEINF